VTRSHRWTSITAWSIPTPASRRHLDNKSCRDAVEVARRRAGYLARRGPSCVVVQVAVRRPPPHPRTARATVAAQGLPGLRRGPFPLVAATRHSFSVVWVAGGGHWAAVASRGEGSLPRRGRSAPRRCAGLVDTRCARSGSRRIGNLEASPGALAVSPCPRTWGKTSSPPSAAS